MGPEIAEGKSNASETDIIHDHSRSVDQGETSLGDGSRAKKGFDDDKLTQQLNDYWKRLLFSKKRRLSSTDTEKEEPEEIDERLENTIRSIVNMDSETSKEKSSTAKINSSPHREEPYEADETLALESMTDCESSAADNQQSKKIKRRRKSIILGGKRKLSSRKTKNTDEPSEVTEKRSRRESKKSRSSLANTSQLNVEGEESDKNNRENNSRNAGNRSINNNELETEDSDVNTGGKFQEKNQLFISPQAQHQNKILKMLNKASMAELKALPRIGPKAALMICQHRELNGDLKSIKDLENMKGWTAKIFTQFLEANNIVLD